MAFVASLLETFFLCFLLLKRITCDAVRQALGVSRTLILQICSIHQHGHQRFESGWGRIFLTVDREWDIDLKPSVAGLNISWRTILAAFDNIRAYPSLSVTYLHTLKRSKATVWAYPDPELKQAMLPCVVKGIVFGHVFEPISCPSWLLSKWGALLRILGS